MDEANLRTISAAEAISSGQLLNEQIITIPGKLLPSFRQALAMQNKCLDKLLFCVWGGLGDQICAEPTLRFALESFTNVEISLFTPHPELFDHLKFKEVFTFEHRPILGDHYLLETVADPEMDMSHEFFAQMLTHCVDYPSLATLRMQLPVPYRQIRCRGTLTPQLEELFGSWIREQIVIHPGRHVPAKTFPIDWWNQVIETLVKAHYTPVIIGGSTTEAQGTVDVDATGCLDLRGKLSLKESLALLQNARALVTNDSAPLHMAAGGNQTKIIFMTTMKRPDYLMHWRDGKFGHRMVNLAKGGIWELQQYAPNNIEIVESGFIEEAQLRAWLPEPKEVVEAVVYG